MFKNGFCIKHGEHYQICNECREAWHKKQAEDWFKKQAEIRECYAQNKKAVKLYRAMTDGGYIDYP